MTTPVFGIERAGRADPYRQGRDAIRIVLDHLLEKAAIAPANYLNPAIVLCSNLSLFREVAGFFPTSTSPERPVQSHEGQQ